MLNPILEQARMQSTPTVNNNLQAAKNMFNMVRNSSNPQAMLQNMLMQNPQLQAAKKLVEQNGGDYQKTFMNLAKSKGIDPDSILKALYN